MGVCLDFGDDRPDQTSEPVATTRGWDDLLRWAGLQPAGSHPGLFGLLQRGFTDGPDEIRAVVAEIDDVLDAEPDDLAPDVSETLEGMADVLDRYADEGIVVVSSQYQSGLDQPAEEDEEPTDAEEDGELEAAREGEGPAGGGGGEPGEPVP